MVRASELQQLQQQNKALKYEAAALNNLQTSLETAQKELQDQVHERWGGVKAALPAFLAQL